MGCHCLLRFIIHTYMNIDKIYKDIYVCVWVSQVALLVKKSPLNAGDIRDVGSIPGLGRSPGGGHGTPL